MGVRGQDRVTSRHPAPMKSAFAPNTLETACSITTSQEEGLYGFPIKQRACTSQIWQTCWSRPASNRATSYQVEDYWSFLRARKFSPPPQATGQRVYAVGQPMGVESTDVPVVLHLQDAL